jgi:hypothetical protein
MNNLNQNLPKSMLSTLIFDDDILNTIFSFISNKPNSLQNVPDKIYNKKPKFFNKYKRFFINRSDIAKYTKNDYTHHIEIPLRIEDIDDIIKHQLKVDILINGGGCFSGWRVYEDGDKCFTRKKILEGIDSGKIDWKKSRVTIDFPSKK